MRYADFEHVAPRRVVQDEAHAGEDDDDLDERQEVAARTQPLVDRLAELVRDQDLDEQPEERRDEREREDRLVRERDRQHAPQPRARSDRAGCWRGVAG